MVQEPRHALSGARVLLIAPEPFYTDRGTPMNVLQMCRALTQAGLRVDLVTYPMGRDVRLPGLRILRAPRVPGITTVPIGFSWRKVLMDVFLALRVVVQLLRHRYRVVHAVEESIFLATPLTWLGVPVVYDLDSLISDQLEYSGAVRRPSVLEMARRLEALALRRARIVLTVCRSLTEAARRAAPDTPVFQVEDAPLLETLRDPDPERVESLRREWELEGRRVLVYTGNHEPYQGIPLLLDAVERLRHADPDVVCVLVGGDGASVGRLRREVADRGVERHVRVVGGRPPEEMPEWMALADVLVSPRREGENTPLKVYTYMASGVPIVATDRVTHTQVLDASTAFLCDPTPEALSAALAQALQEPAEARMRADRARKRLESDYSFRAFERKLLAAYDAVLERPA